NGVHPPPVEFNGVLVDLQQPGRGIVNLRQQGLNLLPGRRCFPFHRHGLRFLVGLHALHASQVAQLTLDGVDTVTTTNVRYNKRLAVHEFLLLNMNKVSLNPQNCYCFCETAKTLVTSSRIRSRSSGSSPRMAVETQVRRWLSRIIVL